MKRLFFCRLDILSILLYIGVEYFSALLICGSRILQHYTFWGRIIFWQYSFPDQESFSTTHFGSNIFQHYSFSGREFFSTTHFRVVNFSSLLIFGSKILQHYTHFWVASFSALLIFESGMFQHYSFWV